MKKVLLIGANGMLGQYIQDIFMSDYKIIPLTKNDLDITDFKNTKIKLNELKPDIIINTSGYNAVDKCEEDKNEFKKAQLVNSESVGNLAKIAKEINAVLIHYSTDYIFDGANEEGYNEYMQAFPISKYGQTKLDGEKQIQKNTENFYIIRTSRLFGKPGKSENTKKNFVDVILTLADTKLELDLVDEEVSSPTYAKDLAKQTKFIIQENKPFGIYHITNEGSCTWYGFAKEIFKQKNKIIKTKPVSADKFPRQAVRPEYSILLTTKLPKIRTWQEALSDYLQED